MALLFQQYNKENAEFHNNSLRFGQWWMNKFYPNYTNPELFYETDKVKCIVMIQSLLDEWHV